MYHHDVPVYDIWLDQRCREYYDLIVNKRTHNMLNWMLIVLMAILPLRNAAAFEQVNCQMHEQSSIEMSDHEQDIKEAIWIVRDTYKNCEDSKFQEIPIEDQDSGVEQQNYNFEEVSQAAGEDPEDSLLKKQFQYLVRLIFQDDPTKIYENYPVSEKIHKFKKKLKYKFKATDKDRLFLRMVYQDGMDVPEAGRKLKWNKWRSYGKHRRLLTQLRMLVRIEDLM